MKNLTDVKKNWAGIMHTGPRGSLFKERFSGSQAENYPIRLPNIVKNGHA
jgi:hypothetical protein